MRIAILNHPIDGDFAVKLNLVLIRHGLTSRIETLNALGDYLGISATEFAIVAVLRPEFVNSDALISLLELADISNIPIFPVIRTPIDIHDWPTQVTFTMTIDFTDHDDKHFIAKATDLAHALSLSNSQTLPPPLSLLELHISNLLLNSQWFDNLEAFNFQQEYAQSPLQHLIENTKYDVKSKDTSGLKRNTSLAEVLLHYPRVVVHSNYLDHTLLVQHIISDRLTRYSFDPHNTQLPVVINLAAWSLNQASTQNLILFGKAANREIDHEKFLLIVYGIENGGDAWDTFWGRITERFHLDSPSLSIVILLEPYTNLTIPLENIVEVKPTEWTFSDLQKYSSHYSRPTSSLVEKAFSHTTHYFSASPMIFAQLLSVRLPEDALLGKLGISDLYKMLVEALWKVGCLVNGDKESRLHSVYPGLAKIAALLTHHGKIYFDLNDAVKLLGNKYALQTCIDSGLLSQHENKIRFAISHLRDYFASVALREYGLPSKLPKLTLNQRGERIPQQWDNSLILLPHLFTDSTKLLERLTEHDPLLALQAISRGSNVPRNLYLSIVEKALISMHQIGDFRLALASQLRTIDETATTAILLEIMREGSWTLRTAAYNLINEFESSIAEDIIPIIRDSEKGVIDKAILYAIQRIGNKAIMGLIQILKCDDVTVRKSAIRVLGALEDKVASPALVARLTDIHPDVVLEAIKALGQLADMQTLFALAKLANYSSSRVSKAIRNSLLQLQQINSEKFIKYVQGLNIVNRYAVVLLICDSNEIVDFALALSYDSDPDVRIAALNGLRNSRDLRSTKRLEECLNDMERSNLSKQKVSEIAARVLALSGLTKNKEKAEMGAHTKPDKRTSSEIVKTRLILAKAPTDSNPVIDLDEDGFKVPASVKSEGDLKITNILQQMREQGWDASNSAAKELRDYAKQLQGTANTQVVNQIIEMLNDSDWVMRWAGVETLGWIGNIHAVPHLVQRLTDTNWKIRVAAIRALAEIKAETAVSAMAEAINDSNAVVREAASEALGSLGISKTISALEKASKDPEEFVRLAAVESLGRINDSSAENPLLSAMSDKSEHVRWAAANALTGIAGAQLDTKIIPFLNDNGGPYWEQKRICDVIADILSQINTEKAKSALVEWRNSQSRSVG